jgi:peptidoglycan/LPS O-acetylase OafA/YrhL
MFLFRKDTQPVKAGARTEVKGIMPTVMLCLVVLLVTLISAYFSYRTVQEFLLAKRNERD